MSLANSNARRVARDGGGRRIRGLLQTLEAGAPLAETSPELLQHIKIDLDALSSALEQHIQQVAPHEPQELA